MSYEHSLPRGLLCLDPLPLLIKRSALHDPLHDLSSVDMLEGMFLDLHVDTKIFGGDIRIVGERDE